MVETASPQEGEEIMQVVGQDRALEADVFEELDSDLQRELLRSRPESEAAEILANMSPDDAADALLGLDEERRQRLLARLPLGTLYKVRVLLGYNPETAGGLMSPEYLALPAQTSVASALNRLRESVLPAPNADTLYVLDGEERPIAALAVVDLLRHEPEATLGSIDCQEAVGVPVHADIPEIAVTMSDFNLSTLPVVDVEGRMVGIITVDDLLEEIVPAEWRVRVQRYAPSEE
jgi:Mg/Co/Ni transporter MgtE